MLLDGANVSEKNAIEGEAEVKKKIDDLSAGNGECEGRNVTTKIICSNLRYVSEIANAFCVWQHRCQGVLERTKVAPAPFIHQEYKIIVT
jgi:hypothetical protein